MSPEKDKKSFLELIFLTKEQLFNFLKNEENSYSDFILKRLGRKQEGLSHCYHIQPRYAQQNDEPWNLIDLSLEEHIMAHALLFECYGNLYDKAAVYLLKNMQKEAFKEMQKQNHINMKKEKKGFYNSELQTQLAKRPKKKRKLYARHTFVVSALAHGFTLQSIKTGKTVIINPNECTSLTEVIDKWMDHPEMLNERQSWIDCEKKHRSSVYSGLTRSLTGHIDQKSKKSVYSIKGWRILGLFL